MQADVCESCGFRFSQGFYASTVIQQILKGSLQSTLKGASVWPLNACNKLASHL